MDKKQLLADMLVSAGFLTGPQAEECLAVQEGTGRRVGDIAVEKGYISEKALMNALENQHKVPYTDLEHLSPDPAVARTVPAELARRNTLAPVKAENGVIYIAIEDPKNFRALDEVRTASRMEVQPMLASGVSIARYIDRLYGSEFARRALSDFQKEINVEEAVSAVAEGGDAAGAPIVRLVGAIIEQAVGIGASDVHIEPQAAHVRVRMRVDGALSSMLTVPLAALNAVIARVKVLGGLNIAERRVPQDGRFHMRVLGREIDVRVSTMPTAGGEKAALRLLDRGAFLIPKAKLGFTGPNMAKFESLLNTPHGIILVTGPTGSGKSTTLYTMLSEINNVRDNIVTIEDPIEYMIDGLNQIQVNPKAGLGFASGLRSILRQDPDVVMVGEIRDGETAEVAIRAAVTGHLVLSTIHTNDAVSTVYRLTDMGIPAYMAAASVAGVISQRLLRVICPKCKQTARPGKAEMETAGLDETQELYKGFGCSVCSQTGYRGRIAVHEVLIADQAFRDLVHGGAPLGEIRKHAAASGMIPLRDSALALVLDGTTTLDEWLSITHNI